jgi:hypothetical protein
MKGHFATLQYAPHNKKNKIQKSSKLVARHKEQRNFKGSHQKRVPDRRQTDIQNMIKLFFYNVLNMIKLINATCGFLASIQTVQFQSFSEETKIHR